MSSFQNTPSRNPLRNHYSLSAPRLAGAEVSDEARSFTVLLPTGAGAVAAAAAVAGAATGAGTAAVNDS